MGGEKRYRSMQEHIRRAHPEHYISKLPATEESFQLMINTPPSERPPPPTSSNLVPHGYGNDRHSYYGEDSSTQTLPETWTNTSLATCCQPLVPRQLSPSYTTTNSSMIGSRKGTGCRTLKHTNKQCGLQ